VLLARWRLPARGWFRLARRRATSGVRLARSLAPCEIAGIPSSVAVGPPASGWRTLIGEGACPRINSCGLPRAVGPRASRRLGQTEVMIDLWTFGGLSWRELFKRTVRESWKDEVFGQAARLAFYHFLALFPALLLAATILARFSGTGSDLLKTLESSLGSILPARAFEMVTGFFAEIGKGAAQHTVWFAMFGSMWAALNGTWAVMSGLNAAYEVEEQRSWWQVALTGAGLTLALAMLGFTSLVLLCYSRKMEAAIMQRAGVSHGVSAVWQVAQWPILAVMLLIAFALLYRFGPNLSDREMRWTTPGSVIAVVLWLCASGLFRGYIA